MKHTIRQTSANRQVKVKPIGSVTRYGGARCLMKIE
jgi:hypothetical protein